MEHIRVTGVFTAIPATNLDQFKKVAAELLDRTQQEQGTLQYDWFFNADQTRCVIHETYADSNAALAHMAAVGELAGQLVALGGLGTVEVFGNPSEKLRALFAGFDPVIYTYLQGK